MRYLIIFALLGLSSCGEDPEPKFCWDCFVTTSIDPGAGSQTIYSGIENVCDKTQAEITALMEARAYNYAGQSDGESYLVSVHTSCIKAD